MRKGFTLIEVLVTALILSIGIVSLLFSFVYSNDMVTRSTHRLNATKIINEHFNEIMNRLNEPQVQSWLDMYKTPTPVYQMYNYTMKQEYLLTLSVDGTVFPSPASDLTLVTATVTWNGGGPRNTVRMSMLTNESGEYTTPF